MEFDGPDLFVADSDQEAADWSSDEINRLGLTDYAHVVVDDLGNVYGVDENRNNVCSPELSLFCKIRDKYGVVTVDGWGYCVVATTKQKLGYLYDEIAEEFGMIQPKASTKAASACLANLM